MIRFDEIAPSERRFVVMDTRRNVCRASADTIENAQATRKRFIEYARLMVSDRAAARYANELAVIDLRT